MPVGEAFTTRQIEEIARSAAGATERTGLHFSVYVGQSEGDPAVYAERLLAASGPESTEGVVIHVDPSVRRVEVVTGKEAARRLSDASCGLATLSMSSSFTGGDLVGGLVTGLRMLGDATAS